MERKNIIEDFLYNCCKNSSIIYDGKFKSVKYLAGTGRVVYVESSRMLDIVEISIPEYKAEIDEPILEEIIHGSKKFRCCESHEYEGCHYVFSIMLIEG